MRSPMRIGLTGGIASGKGIVSQRFEELGIPVIDADVAARAVVLPGMPGLVRVARRFGAGVLNADGGLNRRALRDLIFNDSASREALDSILHPLIRGYMEERAAKAKGPYLVMAIPLLVETGVSRERVDRVLVIDVDEAVQLGRLQARDNTSQEQARAILASQASRDARLAAADDVLENSGTVAELRQAVDRLHAQYLKMAQSSP
jgi:dephospho-CoA kinase